jgi:hypothetical protein
MMDSSPSNKFETVKYDGLVKSPEYRHSGASRIMSGTGSGVYKLLKLMDPGFRRDDAKRLLGTFYAFIEYDSRNAAKHGEMISNVPWRSQRPGERKKES